MNFCDACGTQLETRQAGLVWHCPNCKRNLYANPIPTTDALLVDEEGRVLLGRRNNEPSIGKLNLPGGFVDMDETFEEALARELEEELGLKPFEYGKFVYAGSRVDFHTQNGKTRQILVVVMVADIKHREFEANDEVSEYVWKLPSEIKPDELTTKNEYELLMKAVSLKQAS
jgi:ADP-ribose pyrophosphatase YjhB (NUDIX family)